MSSSRLTEWLQHFQKGETTDGHPIDKSGELGKLAEEAVSLRVARKSIIDEAQGRIHEEELWTQGKLRDLVRARLGENTLFVVSNRYHDPMGEVDELVEKINWKYSDGDWRPIIYQKRQFSPEEIKPLSMMADVCIVSSLHDGMNLVAKEYIPAKNDLSGMLVLSRFTGGASELSDAVRVNPYATGEFVESIRLALEVPVEEGTRRMVAMRRLVSSNNVFGWAAHIITELTPARTG